MTKTLGLPASISLEITYLPREIWELLESKEAIQ